MYSICFILLICSIYLPVNSMESDTVEKVVEKVTEKVAEKVTEKVAETKPEEDEIDPHCMNKSHVPCQELTNHCLSCPTYTQNCTYGEWMDVECHDTDSICKAPQTVTKRAQCLFCFQTAPWEHKCTVNNVDNCLPFRDFHKANCTVNDDVMCLGYRTFEKKVYCNHTKGHKWSTALILSITLGGFGADRFYLGHWQEGIGKLFSFGGLGIWTLVDALLIAIRYLGPADGSLYI